MKTESPKLEIVDRVLTVKLPKKFDSYLQALARALNRSVERLLLEELYSILENFFENGFATAWMDEILSVQTESAGKDLEKQVSQVADLVLK